MKKNAFEAQSLWKNLKHLFFKRHHQQNKDKLQNGRKYLQNIYLIRDLHPEYIKNS